MPFLLQEKILLDLYATKVYNIFVAEKWGDEMEATKKKMGRPVIGKPKTVEIRTRVDEDLSNQINSYCEKKKITRSDFLRKGIDMVLNEEK